MFGDKHFNEVRSRLFSMLNIARYEFLKIFHTCLRCGLKKLRYTLPAASYFNSRLCSYAYFFSEFFFSNNRECFDVVHNYVRIMKFSLKVEKFVFDFNETYNIEEFSEAIRKCNSYM